MPYYVCIAHGLADCTPDSQEYHECSTKRELETTVRKAVREFEREEIEGQDNESPYVHEFRAPADTSVTNWSQRLCIARNSDYVMDVIGMSADEYYRECE